MRFRQRVVEYALKHDNNAKAERRYDTSRQQVQRWGKKYDGTVQSLTNNSRRSHSHPRQHKEKEIKLLKRKYRYHRHEGLAQVYRRCMDSGYKRSYESVKEVKGIRKAKEDKLSQKQIQAVKGKISGRVY